MKVMQLHHLDSLGKNVCAMKWSRNYVKTDMKFALSTNDLRASLIDGRDN